METRKAGPLRFDIGGMHCAACSSRIERVVGRMENVERIAVNLATAKAQIWLKPGTEKRDGALIMERVAGMGFSAVPSQEEDVAVQYREKTAAGRKRPARASGAAGPHAGSLPCPCSSSPWGICWACPCPSGSIRITRPRTFMLAQLALTPPRGLAGPPFLP